MIRKLEEYDLNLKKDHIRKSAQGFEKIKEYFQAELQEREQETQNLLDQTEKAFHFLEEAFGDSQEMVLFVSGLTQDDKAMDFHSQEMVLFVSGLTQDDKAMDFLMVHESPMYLKWSEKLLYRQEEERLLEECRKEEDLLGE